MSCPACVFLLTARWRSSSCNSLHAAVIHCTTVAQVWQHRFEWSVCFFWPRFGLCNMYLCCYQSCLWNDVFFFFLTHGATVDGVSSGPSVRRPLSASQFFSKAHNPGAGLAAPLWMKRVFFLAALRTLQHVPKLSLASLCFFLTHRTTVCRRRKIMPWALLQPSFFCMEKKIDAWGARSMDR